MEKSISIPTHSAFFLLPFGGCANKIETMKAIIRLLSIASLLLLAACDQPNSSGSRKESKSYAQEPREPDLELISYDWDTWGVKVSFYRNPNESFWTMTVRDSWDAMDQATRKETNIWESSNCKCSEEQCIEIMDRSLIRFQRKEAGAHVKTV